MVCFADAFTHYRNMVVALLEDVNAFNAITRLDETIITHNRGWAPLCEIVIVLIRSLKYHGVTRFRLRDMLEKAINWQYPPMKTLFADAHGFVVMQSPMSWSIFADSLRHLCAGLITVVQNEPEKVTEFMEILNNTTLMQRLPEIPHHVTLGLN